MCTEYETAWNQTKDPSFFADQAFLASCSPDAAIAWLEQRDRPKPNFLDSFFPPSSTEWTLKAANEALLDEVLLGRKDHTINIALAKHAVSQLVLSRLYETGLFALQSTVLQNPCVEYSTIPELKLPWGLFEKNDLQLLRSYLANPGLDMLFAASALETTERGTTSDGLLGLPAELTGFFLKCLSQNPKYAHLATKEVEQKNLRPAAFEGWEELNRALAVKLQTLPVNYSNAEGIRSILANRIYQGPHGRPVNRIYIEDEKIDETIARWHADGEPTGVLEWKDILLAPGSRSPSSRVYLQALRLDIARAIVPPSKKNLHSDNPYRVAAFFSNFIPNVHLYWREIDTDDFFARLDECQANLRELGYHFTRGEFILENAAFLASTQGRKVLERRLSWEMEDIDRWVDENKLQRPKLFGLIAREEALERAKGEARAKEQLASQEKELFECHRRISQKVSQLQGLALVILAVIATSLLS